MRGRKEVQLGQDGHAVTRLGATIRAWRRARGLSITRLAEEAGFGVESRGYISRIEHGVIREVGEERLQRLAQALGIAQADLRNGYLPEGHGEEPAKKTLAAVGGRNSAENAVLSRRPESGLLPSAPESEEMVVAAALAETEPVAFSFERTLAAALRRPPENLSGNLSDQRRTPLETTIPAEASPYATPVPRPIGVFVWYLQATLQRHGQDLRSLYQLCTLRDTQPSAAEGDAASGKRRLVAPSKVTRLLQAADGEVHGSVTLSPDELEAVAAAFDFGEQELRLLHAALAGEGVFRLLQDRIDTETASEIAHQVCALLATRDSSLRSLVDRIR